MLVDQKLVEFRVEASRRVRSEPWVSPGRQSEVLQALLDRVVAARVAGFRPVVCIDLDLTSLLAPEVSRQSLLKLAPSAGKLPVPAGQGGLAARLNTIWCGKDEALLPGYTSTSISAYGPYILAQLQVRVGCALHPDALKACEDWVSAGVHAILRSGYWDRDLSRDEVSPGFTAFAQRLADKGGLIVFMSNRDASFREVSLVCIGRLLGDGAQPFAFFGPGGNSFDASSKATAVARIETGVSIDVHYGTAENGQTIYPAEQGMHTGVEPLTIVAVIDDRAENRRQIIEAAAMSSNRLATAGLGSVMDLASAACGFCPEIDVVGVDAVISSFTF